MKPMPNRLDKAHTDCSSLGQYASRYFTCLAEVLSKIDLKQIDALGAELEKARKAGATIFVAGNGGSSSTASTIANDLGFDILKKSNTDKPFRFLALCDNTSVMTAIANDTGYENLFLNQLRIHFRKGDRLLAVSCSGNSPNVMKAVEYVQANGGRVIGLTAFEGGKLAKCADVNVHIPTQAGEYGPAEDAHLILNHILAHWFQVRLRA